MAPLVYLGDLDVDKIHFTPMIVENGRRRVEVFQDDSSTRPGNRLKFRLTKDEDDSLSSPFGLDKINEDQQDTTKRGLALALKDPQALAKLRAFEAKIKEAVTANCKEWLGQNSLSDAEFKLLFNSIFMRPQSEDAEPDTVKIKVKCSDHKVPTAIYRKVDGDRVVSSDEKDLESRQAQVLGANVSVYSIYFIGKGGKFGVQYQFDKMVVRAGEEEDPLADMGLGLKVVKREREGSDEDVGEVKVPKVELLDEAESAM